MSDIDIRPARVHFGVFEVDLRAGELRKHGIRIKLREQPVRILVMLLEHPGEVVLREEIRLRLWPNNPGGVRSWHQRGFSTANSTPLP